MTPKIFCLLLLLVCSGQVSSSIIYDESIDGDLDLSSETLVLSAGLNTIQGVFDNTEEFFRQEAFRFEITEGLQLESAILTLDNIEIVRRFGIGDNFLRQLRIQRRGSSDLLLPEECGILATCVLVADGETVQTPVQFVFSSLAPSVYSKFFLPAGEGIYIFDHSTGGAFATMDFRFDFIVGAVPSPSTLPLGFVALALLVTTRKKFSAQLQFQRSDM